MAAIDLVTVGQAKDWIPGSVSPAPDETIQQIVTAVSRLIVRITGSKIDHTTGSLTYGASSLNSQIVWTERLDGNGSSVLFLNGRPVLNIISLQVNGYTPVINAAYGQPGVYIESTGYSIAFGSAGFGSGQSTTVGWPVGGPSGVFPMGRGNILISYLGGFGQTIPDTNPVQYEAPLDLQVACLQTIAYNYVKRDRIGLDSENVAGTSSTTYSKYEIPPEAMLTIRTYTRVPLGAQA